MRLKSLSTARNLVTKDQRNQIPIRISANLHLVILLNSRASKAVLPTKPKSKPAQREDHCHRKVIKIQRDQASNRQESPPKRALKTIILTILREKRWPTKINQAQFQPTIPFLRVRIMWVLALQIKKSKRFPLWALTAIPAAQAAKRIWELPAAKSLWPTTRAPLAMELLTWASIPKN